MAAKYNTATEVLEYIYILQWGFQSRMTKRLYR